MVVTIQGAIRVPEEDGDDQASPSRRLSVSSPAAWKIDVPTPPKRHAPRARELASVATESVGEVNAHQRPVSLQRVRRLDHRGHTQTRPRLQRCRRLQRTQPLIEAGFGISTKGSAPTPLSGVLSVRACFTRCIVFLLRDWNAPRDKGPRGGSGRAATPRIAPVGFEKDLVLVRGTEDVKPKAVDGDLRSRSCSAMPTRGLLVKGENLPILALDFDGLRLRADRFNGEQLDRALGRAGDRNTKPLKERAILGRKSRYC